ncbi:MAG: LpqN/LpqT family lipoprotein [Mycobacterium sp.]
MSCAIELEIGPGPSPGEFVTRVVDAPAGGEPSAVFQLDIDGLLRERDALENTVLASGASARRIVPAQEQQLRRMGRQLFEALFSERVLGAYRASLGVAQQRGEPLRLVLRLTAPQLAALPWEALFDPETEAYMCRREPLVRHVPAPYTREPLEITSPLRILGLAASPRGLPRLDVEAEQQRLSEALAAPIAEGVIELEWLAHASWDGVHERLLAEQWHVLHFIGHGDYDLGSDQGQIALEGENGRADLVEAEQLADLLNEARPTPRLVVLNSCSSGEQGTRELFSGTAAALVRSGINAVAAMQFTISDTAAIAFARGFYTAIALGRSVDDASRSGRISMLGRARSLEWVTPVLYVRGDTTQLFSVATREHTGHRHDKPPAQQSNSAATQAGQGAVPESPPAIAMTAVQAMYVQARAELRAEHYAAAIGLFDDLLSLYPNYRDVAMLRDSAVRRRELADKFHQAMHAQTNREWNTAVRLYTQVLELQPDHPEAAIHREQCEKAQRIVDLQDELRIHAENENWQAVVEVNDELTAVDPGAADPDGLATQARRSLRASADAAEVEQRPEIESTTPASSKTTTPQNRSTVPGRRRQIAAASMGAVALVAGLTVYAVGQESDSSNPAPSTSTAAASAPAPTTPAPPPNQTISDYLDDNNIGARPVTPEMPGAPKFDLPIPEGWTRIPGDAGDRYFGIVFNAPVNREDSPKMIATVQELTGKVDTDRLLAAAPDQIKQLPGYESYTGDDVVRGTLAGFPASRISRSYNQNGVPRYFSQTTAVVENSTGTYLLQLKAAGPEADAAASRAATLVIEEKITITP